ncbi:hypothetical protein [Streptomyces scopuliridis]|uniref:hypothetical protein n=1 Tax=Streptomyces scopuliridis TaxID=452529 RepID=UPI0036BD295C
MVGSWLPPSSPTGKVIIILPEGRLPNLGEANGRPSFVKSHCFADQSSAQIELRTKSGFPVRQDSSLLPEQTITTSWPFSQKTKTAKEHSMDDQASTAPMHRAGPVSATDVSQISDYQKLLLAVMMPIPARPASPAATSHPPETGAGTDKET